MMNKIDAELYAIQSLNWLANNPKLMEQFMMMSGATISDIRESSSNPEFLGNVIEFFLTSDQLVIDLSHNLKIPPEDLNQIHKLLDSNQLLNWT